METDLVKIVGNYTPLTKAGTEWRGACPIHSGDGLNLYVNPNKQVWACFSRMCHEEYGADAIGFLRSMGMTMAEARERTGRNDWQPTLRMPTRPIVPERKTTKPPAGTPAPDMELKQLGKPSRVWTYRDIDGEILGYVARYEKDGEKEIRCWTWGAREPAEMGWGVGAFSKPRPLYGLHQIMGRADDAICIVEGEKACDAAQEILTQYVCVTWPGGAQAWKHADWQPLRGRKILLWPDNDEPGLTAMKQLGMMLRDPKGLGCK